MGGAVAFLAATQLERENPGIMIQRSGDGRVGRPALLSIDDKGIRTALCRGVILSGGAFRVFGNALSPYPYSLVCRGYTGLVAAALPWLPQPGVPVEELADDPGLAEVIANDPLHFGCEGISAGLAFQIVLLGLEASERASSFRGSLLFVHGEADKICDPEGSRLICRTCGSLDARVIEYPSLRHEILFEPSGGDKVLKDVLEWVEIRIRQ